MVESFCSLNCSTRAFAFEPNCARQSNVLSNHRGFLRVPVFFRKHWLGFLRNTPTEKRKQFLCAPLLVIIYQKMFNDSFKNPSPATIVTKIRISKFKQAGGKTYEDCSSELSITQNMQVVSETLGHCYVFVQGNFP